jgi:uncharacterized membrane protein YphA (DoxX/SURF4 family)
LSHIKRVYMVLALSIVQVLLGLIFVITGSFKFFQTKEKVVASGGAWAVDFAPGVIKVIAGAELLGGLALLAGKFLLRVNYIALAGAACINIIMLGAIYVHLRRKEYSHAAINSVFWLMALFVMYGNWQF